MVFFWMCLLFVCPLVLLLQQFMIVEMPVREFSSLEINLVKYCKLVWSSSFKAYVSYRH